ncbi:hypothetical protein [Actinocrispum sp. NPDC049592]|uniref:hypothetical protein n=1 Tax=Actinocrispum sp. NPDC049592 TaxID=3154835 RepID=UPI00342BE6BF
MTRGGSGPLFLTFLLLLAACGKPDPAGMRVVDADASGAIVLDIPHREYVGLRRDASQVWRQPVRPDGVTCQAQCPEAKWGKASTSCTTGRLDIRLGRRPPVTDLTYASACGIANGGGGIVAQYDQGRQRTSRVRVFDPAGSVIHRVDSMGEVPIIADPATPRVAYLIGDELTEIDAVTGDRRRTLTGVESARYDTTGALVVWRTEGGIAWL